MGVVVSVMYANGTCRVKLVCMFVIHHHIPPQTHTKLTVPLNTQQHHCDVLVLPIDEGWCLHLTENQGDVWMLFLVGLCV